MGKLTVFQIKSLSKPGRYSDGDRLYLQITKSGAKSWLFMYRRDGKQKEMGLRLPPEELARARSAAKAASLLLDQGIDPLRARHDNATPAREMPAFGPFAEDLIADLEGQWRNEKHRAQWHSTLKTYAASIWDSPVDEVETEEVLAILKPVWQAKPETASRVRGRIEKVLDAAAAKGFRSGNNPARWRGHLDRLLPKRQRLTRGHHAAMPYDALKEFVGLLRSRQSVAALAIEFLILSASRSGEVMGMTWDEVDIANKTWTVPAKRMKAGREHRVPLTDRALEILAAVRPLSETDGLNGGPIGYAFRGPRGGPLSVMAMTMQMRRMDKGEFTIHGFRSAFRDWAYEVSEFPRELAEAALAHSYGDATERAYRKRCFQTTSLRLAAVA